MHPDQFADNGVALVPNVLEARECEALNKRMSRRATPSGGTRKLLSESWCATLAQRIRQNPAIRTVLPGDAVAVQCTYFEKSRSRNWLVPFHQDLSIPVADRVQDPDLHGWSVKEGTLFVHAPMTTLEQLVAVRLHLDDCSTLDGPLRVVPGSHIRGPFDPGAALARQKSEVVCTATRGDAFVMRPLILHASSKSKGASLRRVLHFLFGPSVLTHGLRWRHAV